MAPPKSKRSSLSSIGNLKKVSLAETIADTIAHAISDQGIQPGERIVEVTLAEKLNVSRVPVREALKILATQGVIREGRQSYEVADFSENTARQVQEARILLESLLLRDAIQVWHRGGETLDALADTLEQMTAAAEAGDHEGFRRADLAFHREIARSARNDVVHTLWETIARHVLIVLNAPRFRPVDLRRLARQHEQLFGFIRDQVAQPGDAAAVRAALEAHFVPADDTVDDRR